MNTGNDLAQTLLSIAAAFETAAAEWAIGGSFASSSYGEARATNDVDVIALLSEKQARSFVDALGDTFYAVTEVAIDAVRRRSSFNVIDNRTFIKVDIFVPPPGPLGTGQLDRVRSLVTLVGVQPFPVLGPEDVVLQKLRWYQLGGEVSDRQWRDITSVLRLSSGLDHAYLDDVAARSELLELLQRARAAAETG